MEKRKEKGEREQRSMGAGEHGGRGAEGKTEGRIKNEALQL